MGEEQTSKANTLSLGIPTWRERWFTSPEWRTGFNTLYFLVTRKYTGLDPSFFTDLLPILLRTTASLPHDFCTCKSHHPQHSLFFWWSKGAFFFLQEKSWPDPTYNYADLLNLQICFSGFICANPGFLCQFWMFLWRLGCVESPLNNYWHVLGLSLNRKESQ